MNSPNFKSESARTDIAIREAIVDIKALRNDGPYTNGNDDEIRGFCTQIFVGHQHLTAKQLGVASTVWGYRHPSRESSGKQLAVIGIAIGILNSREEAKVIRAVKA